MSLLIDTSILIDLERLNESTISYLRSLQKVHPETPKISFISSFEFQLGLKNKSEKNIFNKTSFLNRFKTVHSTEATIKSLLILKNKYELPLADLLIASQALEHGYILITKDKDFEEIEEIDKIIL